MCCELINDTVQGKPVAAMMSIAKVMYSIKNEAISVCLIEMVTIKIANSTLLNRKKRGWTTDAFKGWFL